MHGEGTYNQQTDKLPVKWLSLNDSINFLPLATSSLIDNRRI
ncbi:MAG: hypothetical protein OFPII_10680 [Osedax symbiont Rs1]|nr:MAG: hypothetical protein OFPII_10680 [Osedax symbiont Rs1]